MSTEIEISNYCHINTNKDGDRFVGIKSDQKTIKVCFPIGYHLPAEEREIRSDIINLIKILSEFTEKSQGNIFHKTISENITVIEPINAYLDIINDFFDRGGYYVERDVQFKKNIIGRINWVKTIKQIIPIIENQKFPIYTKFISKHVTPNSDNLITHIHKYCVYESFRKIGWLFTSILPDIPTIKRDTALFLSVLNDKLRHTNNDKNKKLFSAMISLLNKSGENNSLDELYFGTENFEYVWEKMIDKAFGISDKSSYFPNSYWYLRSENKKHANAALEPDTIMIVNSRIYVLDAKYYRYGITGLIKDLPNSSSINKQITYGEYVARCNMNNSRLPVYNAFIMPFDMLNPEMIQAKIIDGKHQIQNIGEAIGTWKENNSTFERVQGILIDTRYLMKKYLFSDDSIKKELADYIELVPS